MDLASNPKHKAALPADAREAAGRCIAAYAQGVYATPLDDLARAFVRFYGYWVVALGYADSEQPERAAKYYIKMDELFRSKVDWGRFQHTLLSTWRASQQNVRRDLKIINELDALPAMLTGGELASAQASNLDSTPSPRNVLIV